MLCPRPTGGDRNPGPLPQPWKVVAMDEPGHRFKWHFSNLRSGERTVEDPRLVPSTEWKRIKRVVNSDDPEQYDFFEHKETR